MWGGGMVAMKFALVSFDAWQIMAARVAAPAFLYLCASGKWRKTRVAKGDWKWFCLLTLCEPCLFFFCVTNALKYASASEAGVIAAALPLTTAMGAWLFLREKLSRGVVIGLTGAIIGIGGMSLAGGESSQSPRPWLGAFLMIAGIFFSSGYTLCARYLARKYSGLFISAVQALGGSIVFIPICLFQPGPAHVSGAAIGALAYMALGIGVCAYLGCNWALGHVKAIMAGALGVLTPVCTLFFAWLILHERLNGSQLCFAALALSGVMLATAAQE